jgi:putative oxidoreductase
MLRDGVGPLLGRLMLSLIFLTSAYSKAFGWSGNVAYMQSQHMPMIPFFIACALVVELFGSICLILGWNARVAAFIMFLYLIPVTFRLHQFMSTHFQKNIAIMGGLLYVAVYGAGKWALSGPQERRTPPARSLAASR